MVTAGIRVQRDRVWFAKGGAPAWSEIQNPTRRQGRGHELAAVVRPGSPALNTALRKSGAIRKELANAATLDTQPGRWVKGYVSWGARSLWCTYLPSVRTKITINDILWKISSGKGKDA